MNGGVGRPMHGLAPRPLIDGELERLQAKWRFRWRKWRLALGILAVDSLARLIVTSIHLIGNSVRADDICALVFAFLELGFVTFAGIVLYNRIVSTRMSIIQVSLYAVLSAALIAVIGLNIHFSKELYDRRLRSAYVGNTDRANGRLFYLESDDVKDKRRAASQKFALDTGLDVIRAMVQAFGLYVLIKWLAVSEKMHEPFGTAIEMNVSQDSQWSPSFRMTGLEDDAGRIQTQEFQDRFPPPIVPRSEAQKQDRQIRTVSDPFRNPGSPRVLHPVTY